MLYPAYIRRNKDGTHKATFPDFNDSFSNIRGRGYLSATFRQTIEGQLRTRQLVARKASRPEDWFSDKRFQGGYWTLIELNTDYGHNAPLSTGYRSALG